MSRNGARAEPERAVPAVPIRCACCAHLAQLGDMVVRPTLVETTIRRVPGGGLPGGSKQGSHVCVVMCAAVLGPLEPPWLVQAGIDSSRPRAHHPICAGFSLTDHLMT